MSKIARIVGQVAGVIAFAAGVAMLFVPGFQPLGIGLMTIAGVASAVSPVIAANASAFRPPGAQI